MNYSKHYNINSTPQNQPIPGKKMVANSGGGFTFATTDFTRLDRFLILGTEGGTYYTTERDITLANADGVIACVKADGVKTVNRIVEISESGRAPKNEPAIFALALAIKHGDDATKKAARLAIPRVCRIGTHLFSLTKYMKAVGVGWGRGNRDAVAKWYQRDLNEIAYQVVKYGQRGGWSHRDVLRLCHADPAREWIQYDPGTAADLKKKRSNFYRWVVGKDCDESELPEIVKSVNAAKNYSTSAVIDLIYSHGLTREMIPTEMLKDPEVWAALLEKMPMTAMIRNLGNMSKVGLLKPLSNAASMVCHRLTDPERILKARIHPVQILAALNTYKSGCGARGSGTWNAVPTVIDALDTAFYASFGAVEPANKKTLIALDVSDSMTWSDIAGIPGLTPRQASAAMSMVTARTEPDYHIMGFSHELVDVKITAKASLDHVIKKIQSLPMGSTDCSLPMVWATNNKVEVDTFVIYTDNETNTGRIHPVQALKKYRQKMGIPARLVVAGMTATNFTIADPDDSGSLDIVGFDSAAPNLISSFSRGDL